MRNKKAYNRWLAVLLAIELIVLPAIVATAPRELNSGAKISQPKQGQRVAGKVRIVCETYNIEDIAFVIFYIDGEGIHSTNVRPYSYIWDTTSYPDGAHEIVCEIYSRYMVLARTPRVIVITENSKRLEEAPQQQLPEEAAAATKPETIAPMQSAATTKKPASPSVSWEKLMLKITLNGSRLNLEVQPRLYRGYHWVWLRELCSSLGAEVDWDNINKVATAIYKNKLIAIKIGASQILVADKPIELPQPAYLYKNRTMIPVRVFLERAIVVSKFYWRQEENLLEVEV